MGKALRWHAGVYRTLNTDDILFVGTSTSAGYFTNYGKTQRQGLEIGLKGHLMGDEVLIMLAQVMRHAFRFDDQLFRFGGEEFIALLQPTDQASAQMTLERFRAEVEKTVFSRVGHVTVSVGFSRLMPNDTPTDVIDRADEALYYAKRHGRNRVDCYEQLIVEGVIEAKEIAKGEVELF